MLNEIQALEENIRQAQLTNDVSILEDVLSDDLQFVFFDGSVASKQDDIKAHQNKIVIFHEIKFSEQVIKTFKGLASVTVLAEIKGTMNGSDFHGFYRYGRTWANLEGRWQLISGCVFPVNP
jgi:hypothetical protein